MLESLETAVKKRVPLGVRQVVRRSLFPARRLRLEWKLTSGIEVTISDHSDWVIYNDIFVDGEYDLAIADTLDDVPEGRSLNILDLGANVGFFTLRVIDQMRRRGLHDVPVRLTLVEGNARTSRILHATLERNELLGENLQLVHGLIGERSGTRRMVRHAVSGMSTIHGGSTFFDKPVRFVDIEEIIGDNDVDLLKSDIEGSEQVFLENYPALLRRTRRAVFELHPRLCDVPRCLELMKAAGFDHSHTLRSAPTFEVRYFWREPRELPSK